jgi:peroxiredoxin
MSLKPRQPAPELVVDTLAGGTWRLASAQPRGFTMIVVYRGLHCPICKTYLRDLVTRLPELAGRGVEPIAVSADTRERAARARAEWELEPLRIGYGLPLATAREWGLFVSRAVREGEPAEFIEPGCFLVRPDGTLFYAAINSAPWGRPLLAEILRGIDFAIERNVPARGEA